MKEIGKIQSIDIGYGGYDDAAFGLRVTLMGKAWGTCDFIGPWAFPPLSKHAKWGEEDRDREFSHAMRRALELCKDAKKKSVAELKGVPIEAELDGPNGRLLSWRILTEVL